jgi:predicted enzyme related to lactoylglutathione lyase
MKLELVSIPVSDQNRALEFYEFIGFSKVKDNLFGEGMRWLELTIGGETNIVLVNWFPEMPAGSIHGLIIHVDDIESRHQELSEKISLAPIFNTPWGKFANFKDPDGNGWSLREALS